MQRSYVATGCHHNKKREIAGGYLEYFYPHQSDCTYVVCIYVCVCVRVYVCMMCES